MRCVAQYVTVITTSHLRVCVRGGGDSCCGGRRCGGGGGGGSGGGSGGGAEGVGVLLVVGIRVVEIGRWRGR